MKSICKFLRRNQIGTERLVGIILLQLAISLLTLAQPEVLRRATSAITGKSTTTLQSVILFAAITAVLFLGLSFFQSMFSKKTQNFYEQSLGTKMIEKLNRMKMRRLAQKQFGDVSTAVIRNVEAYADTALQAIINESAGVFSLALVFVYMCLIQWQLAVCVLVYNLVIRFFAVFVERKIKKNSLEATEAMKESGNELSALLRNMLMVRIYSNGEFFQNRLKKKEKAVQHINWKSFVWSNGFQDFIWAFSKLAEFLIVYGVGAWLIVLGRADLSILLTFIFANDLFTIGINSLSYYMDAKAQADAYQLSLEEILDESDCEDERRELQIRDSFSVQFRNVSFAYGDNKVLENVSFTIHPGERVLLQGPNGQGKSTILKLISGLYRPQAGEILFGDARTRQVNINSLLRHYGYISQHSNLLEGDISENLALSTDYDTQKVDSILAALNLAGCKETEPQNLSMGEKQRLNIARSLYRGFTPLLLCDEIFSNVDQENRGLVVDALNRDYAGATVIMVSHEEVGYQFDRVLNVENRAVQEGAI